MSGAKISITKDPGVSGDHKRYDTHLDGENIAFAVTQPKMDDVVLQSLYTHPAHRRKGYAKALLKQILADNPDKRITTKPAPYEEDAKADESLSLEQLKDMYKTMGIKESDVKSAAYELGEKAAGSMEALDNYVDSEINDYLKDKGVGALMGGVGGAGLGALTAAISRKNPKTKRKPWAKHMGVGALGGAVAGGLAGRDRIVKPLWDAVNTDDEARLSKELIELYNAQRTRSQEMWDNPQVADSDYINENFRLKDESRAKLDEYFRLKEEGVPRLLKKFIMSKIPKITIESR